MRHSAATCAALILGSIAAVAYLVTMLVRNIGAVDGQGPTDSICIAVLLGWIGGGAVEQMCRARERGDSDWPAELIMGACARVAASLPLYFALVFAVMLLDRLGVR